MGKDFMAIEKDSTVNRAKATKKFPMLMIMAMFSLPLFYLTSIAVAVALSVVDISPIVKGVGNAVIAEVLIIIFALFVTDQLRNRQWKTILGLSNFKWSNLVYGALIGFGLYVVLQIAHLILSLLTEPVGSSNTSESLGTTEGNARFIVLLLVVPFIVPFVEEVFFRGYILGFIRKSEMFTKKVSLIAGSVISILFFTALHVQGFSTVGDWFVIGWISFFALVQVFLTIRTGSIWMAFGSHMLYNLITSLSIMSGN